MLTIILYAIVAYILAFVLWAGIGLFKMHRQAEHDRLTRLARQNPQPPPNLRKGYRNMALVFALVAAVTVYASLTQS